MSFLTAAGSAGQSNGPPTATSAPMDLPLLGADPGGGDPVRWARAHREPIRQCVLEHGALLVRGLGLRDSRAVADVFAALSHELMPAEREAFAARRLVAPGVHTTSTWPANQQMCAHQELSYTLHVPATILFACTSEPTRGGQTGLVDMSAVRSALPSELVARFERLGWMLVRNYSDEIGASVAESFGTDDTQHIAQYCRDNAITARWQPDGGLATTQVRPAVISHPVTGRRCWFNQIAFLSEWTIDAEVREFLLDCYGEEGLPFTTRCGDGTPIGPETIDLLNAVYEQHTTWLTWQAGDLLLVDNIRTAHGRRPYDGPREVLVGLADPVGLRADLGTGVDTVSRGEGMAP